MKKFSDFLVEGNPLARTFTLKQKGLHSAFISAERQNRTAKENAIAKKHLEKRVRAAGYGFRHTEGEYNEGDGMAKEPSYQVVANKSGARNTGKFRQFIRTLGKELNQQTILHNNPKGEMGGTGKEIVTTKHTAGEPRRVGQKTTYGRMHYNTPNKFGITRFKNGQTITYK